MADDYIVHPPIGGKKVSLTRNCDATFVIRRRDADGNAVDWDSQVWVFVDTGGRTNASGELTNTTATRVEAVVVGADALIRIESRIADEIKHGAAWRAVRSVESTPESLEKPLMVGWFERYDGGLQ